MILKYLLVKFWKARQDGRYEKIGIKKEDDKKPEIADQTDNKEYNEASDKKTKQAWARLIKKIYEINPLVCPKCNCEMEIVAIIQDRSEIEKIIACLEKKNKAPPVVENVL